MTDNLNEKNKQVKDDFMNEITKVVKKIYQKTVI